MRTATAESLKITSTKRAAASYLNAMLILTKKANEAFI